MRIISILTACIVSVALYFLVMERDRVMAFAGKPESEATAETASDAPEADDLHRVSVVALHSVAQPVEGAVLVRGRTEAVRQVEVRSETSGTVISEPLRRGAFVTRDQLLCKLDPGTREISLAEAEAALASARARVPEARAALAGADAALAEAQINDRAASRLREGGFASETRVAGTNAAVSSAEAAVESAKSALETAQSGIQSAEAGVAAAQKEIERLTILAPFEGLLETDSAELGSLMQPGALCATVIQLDPIKLVGFVPETEVDRIATGDPVAARLATGRQVQGTVSFLSKSADPNTRTFRIEVQIPNPDLAIRDGQTVEILVSSGQSEAHRLPQSALTLDDDGRIGVRLIDTGNRAAFAPVTVLRDTVDGIWVAGLPDTADVIVVGQEYVADGVPVAPTFREAAE